jgi:MoxR-like ATPase
MRMAKKSNLIQNTFADEVRDFFNLGKVKRLFRVGTEVANAIQPFVERQTATNAVRSAFMIGKVIIDDLEVWPENYFSDTWETPYPCDFNKIIIRSISHLPYKTIRTSEDSLVIHVVEFEKFKLGYLLNTKNNFVDRVYIDAKNLEEAKREMKLHLWNLLKDDNVVLRYDRRRNSNVDNDALSLDVDDAFRPMPSKMADQYSAYLKKCIDADVSRSVMLYGPPGTGKSTLARSIVNNLGMKSFRIRVEDISHIDTTSVYEAINIFEPDAVILDDFDRASSQSSLLETLEYFQRHVKLVIATVNNKKRLDDAILRPGRFDELVNVKTLDDDAIRAVLGNEYKDSFELVKTWPIAFIQEYVKRRRFMNPVEAESSVKELAHRVKQLASYDEEDEDTEGVNKVLLSEQPNAKDIIDKLLKSGSKGKKKRGFKIVKRFD